jgi:hypothetical protein
MAIYRFRVTFEDYDDVYRDIEVRSNQTFEDLHHAIQSAIGFDASKPASFYMSNDNWTKGREITSRELSEEQAAQIASLRKARLCDYIADPHQKIYYLFDFSSKWAFHTELTKISKTEEPGADYPRCIKSAGEAPKQYGINQAGPLPVPEDFDPDVDDMLLDEDEDEPNDIESETDVATEDEAKTIGDIQNESDMEDSESDDEFETADGDMMEEDGQDNDEF